MVRCRARGPIDSGFVGRRNETTYCDDACGGGRDVRGL